MADLKDKLIITRIWAQNFKSLRRFSLDLSPLTVLVGRNGSGKSNIIDVLRFISDAFYDGVQSAVTYRNGPRSVLHVSNTGRDSEEFTVGLRAGNESITAEYQLTVRGETRDRISVPEERINLHLGGKARLIVVRNGVFTEPKLTQPIRRVLRQLPKKREDRAGFTPMLSLIGDQPSFAAMIAAWLFPDEKPEDIVQIASAISKLSSLLGEMRFYRIFPDAIREPQPVSLRDSLEEDGSNFASVLRSLKASSRESYARVVQALQRVAPGIVDIEVRNIGGIQFVRLVHSDPSLPRATWKFDMAQESDGISRALALFVAVQQRPAPSLLAIEEPELGIHTGVLSVISDLLEGATSESQILVSTHSSDFLDFVSTESIRAVASVNGESIAGPVAKHQIAVIRDELMTAGYIHRVEGLEFDESTVSEGEADW